MWRGERFFPFAISSTFSGFSCSVCTKKVSKKAVFILQGNGMVEKRYFSGRRGRQKSVDPSFLPGMWYFVLFFSEISSFSVYKECG